jgi:hypothetical protein
MSTIVFSFVLNNKVWSWEKTFYDNNNLNERIEDYLSKKSLPLDLKDLKWKLKNA